MNQERKEELKAEIETTEAIERLIETENTKTRPDQFKKVSKNAFKNLRW